MKKEIAKVVFVMTGIIGIVLALLTGIASLIMSGNDAALNTVSLLVSIIALLGSIIAMIMGLRLKQETKVRTGIVYLVVGTAFILSGIMVSAPLTFLPGILCAVASAISFRWEKVKK